MSVSAPASDAGAGAASKGHGRNGAEAYRGAARIDVPDEPLGREFAGLGAYLDRLMARPSFARVLQAAAPYFAMFPLENKPAVPRRG